MHRLFLITLCIVGAATVSNAQQSPWLATIRQHALPLLQHSASPFQAANPGPALYFVRQGGIDVPFIAYVPRGYNSSEKYPLIVFLHGAILARDSFQFANPSVADEPIFSVADQLHAIVLFPFARHDFAWPSSQQANEAVLAEIDKVRQLYHIDEGRIFLGGISMGAGGVLWFIRHNPSPFAGFFTVSAPINENLESTQLAAISSRPLFSAHAEDDPVCSYAQAKKTYENLRATYPLWHFTTIATGGHRFIYNADTGRRQLSDLVSQLIPQTR